jgi:hypothetical protein
MQIKQLISTSSIDRVSDLSKRLRMDTSALVYCRIGKSMSIHWLWPERWSMDLWRSIFSWSAPIAVAAYCTAGSEWLACKTNLLHSGESKWPAMSVTVRLRKNSKLRLSSVLMESPWFLLSIVLGSGSFSFLGWVFWLLAANPSHLRPVLEHRRQLGWVSSHLIRRILPC